MGPVADQERLTLNKKISSFASCFFFRRFSMVSRYNVKVFYLYAYHSRLKLGKKSNFFIVAKSDGFRIEKSICLINRNLYLLDL